MEPAELLFLMDRAVNQLVEADSEEAWRFKLADFVERIGEVIEREPPHSGETATTQEPIIGKLAECIREGYSAAPGRAVEREKQKLDFMLIMGGDYAEDSIFVLKNGPDVTHKRGTDLLRECMKWRRCQTMPEAVQRLMECWSLSRKAAENRAKKANKTYNLGLKPGGKFGHPTKSVNSFG